MDFEEIVETKILTPENTWKLVASGAAVGAGIAAHVALRRGWKAVTRKDPPNDPASSDTDWDQAILWTVSCSILVGLCRLAARRGAMAVRDHCATSSDPVRSVMD